MSALHQIFEVARRDFLQRARSKAFLITTLVTIAAIFGLVPLIAQDVLNPPPVVVGTVGATPPGFEPRLEAVAEAFGFEVKLEKADSLQSAEQKATEGDLDVVVVDGRELVFARSQDARLSAALNAVVQGISRDAAIADLGLSAEDAARIVAPPPLDERVVAEPDPEDMPRRVGAEIGAILLYMAILIFGQFIMMGVMEEKQSRVVEVVLAKVKPERLLTGKILGIGLLGLIQLVAIGASILAAVFMLDIPGVSLPSLSLGLLSRTLFWFLLGFALYAVLYGALGATVTRQEDAQGAAMLPVILLLPGYFISFTAIEDPDGLASVIGSLVPFSAPIVMPVRAATGTVPMWQVGLAIALVLLTTLIVIRLGARIYRGAVLSIGRKVRLREAFKAATG
jgi:ABC-2 type transport system permease protein